MNPNSDSLLTPLICGVIAFVVYLMVMGLSGCSVPAGEGRRIGLFLDMDIKYNLGAGADRTGKGEDGLWDYWTPNQR